jgi:Fe2+ transport system protein FeoA
LHELGLRRGAEVEMIQPGSPCIVRLEGHRLCLRGDELLNVLVRPEVTA